MIEKEGLTPLHQNLKELGGWPVLMGNNWKEDDFSWDEAVYKLHKIGYSIDYFFSFFVDIDLKNSTKYPIYVRIFYKTFVNLRSNFEPKLMFILALSSRSRYSERIFIRRIRRRSRYGILHVHDRCC